MNITLILCYNWLLSRPIVLARCGGCTIVSCLLRVFNLLLSILGAQLSCVLVTWQYGTCNKNSIGSCCLNASSCVTRCVANAESAGEYMTCTISHFSQQHSFSTDNSNSNHVTSERQGALNVPDSYYQSIARMVKLTCRKSQNSVRHWQSGYGDTPDWSLMC